MAEHFPSHMSDTDTLLWDAERDPLLRSTIVSVALLERSPDWDRLRARIEHASRTIPRFRQRVLEPPLRLGPPQWSAVPDFDLDFHLRHVRMPTGGDLSSLLELVRPTTMSTFDRAQPLWEFTLVEGLDGGGAALVMKVHHAVTDGIAGMRLALTLLDLEPDGRPAEADASVDPIQRFGPASLVTRSLALTGRRALGLARDGVGALLALGADPARIGSEALRTAGSLARYLAPAFTPRSPIMQARGLDRRIGTIELELTDLRGAARVGGGSLNDAFVAGVSGGLARYHRGHGSAVRDLRMMMPISVRAQNDKTGGGNQFTPSRVPIPLTIDDPIERMHAIQLAVRTVRDEPAVALTEGLAAVLGRLPRFATTALFGSMLKGADFVTSNIPGAPFPVYLSGARVTRMFAFPPTCGSAANVTLLSHCGTCCIGVIVDSAAVPDADRFIECVGEGLAEVTALA
jgi:diacylglycerol O-acyltransferase / wax synthase